MNVLTQIKTNHETLNFLDDQSLFNSGLTKLQFF